MSDKNAEKNTEKKTEEKSPFAVDSDVPAKYRRCYGDKKGKVFPRQCKGCLWWKNAMPGTFAKDANGNPVGCATKYWNAGRIEERDDEGKVTKRGPEAPTPEWFRCQYFLHHEQKKAAMGLNTMNLGLLRAVSALAPEVASLLPIIGAENLKKGLEELLGADAPTRNLVLVEWAKEFLAIRGEGATFNGEVVAEGSEWRIKDPSTGFEWEGTVWKSTAKEIKLRVDKEYRKELGELLGLGEALTEYTMAPELFANVASPLAVEEEAEEAEE